MKNKYELVIWLEIHVRVKSQTKMFCSCKNAVELAEEPNINVCPVCMGFPGMLPKLNAEVVRLGVIAGQAMKCEVNKISRFDRKSYFYPDLPNSFQTTQLYETIVWQWDVRVLVNGELKHFKIHHMHLENDAGKLTHVGWKTLCDYNRAWSPLMEIVTEPDFRSKEDVVEFLKELQKMMRFANVSDADMEKGQLRCDVNISLRKFGENILNNRVELKNINSFSSIGRAIDTEFARQAKLYEKWEYIDQETRGWDDDKWVSNIQRSKENAMDYRYFPEPDLLPVVLTDEFIADCASKVGELPIDRRIKYLSDYKFKEDDARILSADRDISDYFDSLVVFTKDPNKSSSYITSVLLAMMKEDDEVNTFAGLRFEILELAEVIALVNKDELSSTNAKLVIEELFANGGKTSTIVDSKWLRQTNDLWALELVVDNVIESNPIQVADYKWGNERIFGFLVGQCMKASAWAGNPKIFNDILKSKLG